MSDTARIDRLRAEFADPDLEARYRADSYPAMAADFRLAIALGAIFFIVFGSADRVSLGPTPQFWLLFHLRLVVAAIGFILILLARRLPALVTSGLGASIAELAAIAVNFLVDIYRPHELAAHASAMAVILMAIYVFVPNRFFPSVAMAALATTSFAIYLFVFAEAEAATLLSILLVLLLVNTFGMVAAWRFSQLRRREYAALAAERRSKEALLDEIARREILETALTIEKNAAERARDAAEAASRAKSRFLAAASHDLRQPMHALSLFAATLVERLRYPEVRQIADQMQASITSLTSLLDALLDISKLDAGTVKPQVLNFRLQEIFDGIHRDFVARALDKGIRLRVVPTSAVVKSDPLLLARIVRNLVSNAVNYTREGGVLVGARRRGRLVRIEVWDTGPGIPEAERERIFEEFYQIGNPERDRSKGLGLGLAIVRRLADLLRHGLEFRSRPGRGTVFAITVPASSLHAEVNAAASEPPGVPVLPAPGNPVVVLIEDERIIREATRTLLCDWGCTVVACASAIAARAELAQRGLRPDLILADYRLAGGHTGIEAIDLLHATFGPDIPAVLITGDAAAEHLKEAEERGLSLLHKPVPPAKLRALIASIQVAKTHHMAGT